MNTKIEELAKRASFDVDQIRAEVLCPDYQGPELFQVIDAWNKLPLEVRNHVKTVLQEAQEKFAELIVQECADIGNNYQDILGNEPECFNCRKVAYGIVDKIKQHFGIE